jgi:hypothetical protein
VEICTVGSVRGESVGAAMVDLNGHEAGNSGYSQGRPTARRVLLYSEEIKWATGIVRRVPRFEKVVWSHSHWTQLEYEHRKVLVIH